MNWDTATLKTKRNLYVREKDVTVVDKTKYQKNLEGTKDKNTQEKNISIGKLIAGKGLRHKYSQHRTFCLFFWSLMEDH